MLFFSARASSISSSTTSRKTSGNRELVAAEVRLRSESCRRSGKRAMAWSILGGFASSSEAQTAHCSGAVATLGRGFSSSEGAAVDGSGNGISPKWEVSYSRICL
jgi:hypothetical protein